MSQVSPGPDQVAGLSDVQKDKEDLERRLLDGEQKIRAAREQGDDPGRIARAEARWVSLLRRYEQVCAQLEAALKRPSNSGERESEQPRGR